MFVDFISCFRKTKPFKILGFISIILVPIMALTSTQSFAYYSNGFGAIATAALQIFWIYILFPILLVIIVILFILLTIIAVNSIKKFDHRTAKNNIFADIGYIFCLFYLIYCLIFYAIIVPSSLSSIDKSIKYINSDSQNFFSLSNNNIDNLCITSRRNTLNCFVENIKGGYIDKKYEGDAILTFDRIYYFHSNYKKDELSNKLLLINSDVFVSDKLKIVAPIQITRIFNDYFYTKDKNIKLRLGY